MSVRQWAAGSAAAIVLSLGLTVGWKTHVALAAQPLPKRADFSQDSRAELALARARGDASVVLLLAAREGQNPGLVQVLSTIGGEVQFREDAVDYLRTRVPLNRVDLLLNSDRIESAAVDAPTGGPSRPFFADRPNAPSDQPDRDTAGFALPQHAADWPPRWPDYPLRHPYSPLEDLGGGQLLRQHPTYDGRGVTIGHVEVGVDLLVPELETAYTLDGKETPKIVDYFTATDPKHSHGEDARQSVWVLMNEEVMAADGRFSVENKTVIAPREGRFRFGVFDGERLDFCQSLKKRDSRQPPDPPSSPSDAECRFNVLWDDKSQEVWLDTNRDESFADERAMRDFRDRRDVGTIGRDEPDSVERESFSFTVQVRPQAAVIAINVGDGRHATMVAGSAVGGRGGHGLYDGVAPGAGLVVIDYGGSCAASFIEATIAAFEDARIDIVLVEQNAFIALPYRRGDGQFTPTLITSRLIRKYQKPFVVPADNAAGINVTSEHGNVPWGFAVGSYESKESYRINSGYLVERQDNLHQVGASGPGGNGSIKPDVLAPSGYLTSAIPTGTYARPGIKGLYRLPPGYRIGGGTSQAASTMAGALALLISAAKQEGIPYDAERIWRAMTSGARFLPNIPAHKQGNGVINVTAAFELLKAYAGGLPPTITSRGPVRTAVSAWLETPHEGVSLWEREGWRAAEQRKRTLTLTRTSGPKVPMTFAMTWEGNDGTFAGPPSVTLPLGKAVQIDLTVTPTTSGPHSALLTLDHPAVPGHAYRVMTTIVAAEPFEKDKKFTITRNDSLERPGPSTSYFMDVPNGTDALMLSLTGERGLGLFDPIGREGRGGSAPTIKLVRTPMPGAWEAVVSIGNDSLDLLWNGGLDQVVPPAFFTTKAMLLGASIDAGDPLALAPGESHTTEIAVTNRYATFKGSVASVPLAAVRTSREQLKRAEQRTYDLQVPPGSPWLVAYAKGAPGAVLDMYLFDCTGKRCIASASAVGQGPTPSFRYANPKPGAWKIVVDAALVGQNGITVDYMDAVLDPSLGGVSSTDAARERDIDARWNARVNVWLARPPADGRTPHAPIVVQTSQEGQVIPVGLQLIPIRVK